MSETGASASSWEDLARSAADVRGDETDASVLRQLLAFTVAGAPYALPVESVREIVRLRPVTPIPRVTADVRGVISLRGEIIQVVDLRRRLGAPPEEPSRASRIIVVQSEDGRIAGILVDAVREVLRIPEDEIGAGVGESAAVRGLCVRGEEFVSLIDLERVLDIDDVV